MALYSFMACAQICQTNSILATTPTNRFTINNDGTVNDNKTDLTWKKCSEGQSGADCNNGSAILYTWQAALQQAQSVNNNGGFAEYQDWRLPNIKELNSIIEEQCTGPSINLVVFPRTPSNWYWSSSPGAYSSTDAWSVYFANGDYNGYTKYGYRFIVRLVR